MHIREPYTMAALSLWRLRADIVVHGAFTDSSIEQIIAAFRAEGEGSTMAACLIVSGRVSPDDIDHAQSQILKIVEDNKVNDLLSLRLILEALQFVSADKLKNPAVRSFAEEAACIKEVSELALHIRDICDSAK